MGDAAFGVFAGTAIHSTPQVIGAGFIFSDLAGKTATAVKLVRNCFMAPLAFGIAMWTTRASGAGSGRTWRRGSAAKAFPWFLIGYFLLAGLNTAGAFTAAQVEGLGRIGRFLITVSMAGIGLNTVFRSFKSIGWKPLLVGLLGAIVVAAVSISMIALAL